MASQKSKGNMSSFETTSETYLKVSSQEDRFQRVIKSKVKATINHNSNARDVETSIQSCNAIRCQGLPIDINEPIKLSLSTSFLGRFWVIGQPRSCIIQWIHKEEWGCACGTSWSQVPCKPFPVPISVFLHPKQAVEKILECKVEGLSSFAVNKERMIFSWKNTNIATLKWQVKVLLFRWMNQRGNSTFRATHGTNQHHQQILVDSLKRKSAPLRKLEIKGTLYVLWM